jgi:hypothetical protein
MVEEEGHGDLVAADIRLGKQASKQQKLCSCASRAGEERESEREKERRKWVMVSALPSQCLYMSPGNLKRSE